MIIDPVFDQPMWTFQIPPEGTEPSIVLICIEVCDDDNRFIGVADVITPTELVKYAKDVMKVEDIRELILYLDKVGGRYYLSVSSESQEYDLWYYTKSNLPLWAGRIYE